ncbi:MAG: hypothetical protein IPM23_21990 [Candidatus Melainabacteria bacterium]|nr:hypothetical protein [Candidatus Melainabacteria bacterium]
MTRIIELTERAKAQFAKDEIPKEIGEEILQRYGSKIDIDFPSPKTENMWCLQPRGWIGEVGLSNDYRLSILPKVPIGNIFRMLEYAYGLQSAVFHRDLVRSANLEEFFESLAIVLARLVLERANRGLQKKYLRTKEQLSVVKGRLDTRRLHEVAWTGKVHCDFAQQTVDVIENQIPAYALNRILRTGLVRYESLHLVQRAFRSLESVVTLKPKIDRHIFSRLSYNRLDGDYEVIHSISRFFIENTGPRQGDERLKSLSFLVNMDQLFEQFVAAWFRENTPREWRFGSQVRVVLTSEEAVQWGIDLVWYGRDTADVICVADTKYKTGESVSSDAQQIVAYAAAKRTRKAFLIYPDSPISDETFQVGDFEIGCISFPLDSDLEESGKRALERIVQICSSQSWIKIKQAKHRHSGIHIHSVKG